MDEQTPSSQVQPSPQPTPGIQSKPSKKRAKLFVVLLLLLAAGVAGAVWWFSRSDEPATVTTSSSQNQPVYEQPLEIEPALVSITAEGFVPQTIQIKPGQAVIWQNDDVSPHVVASNPYPTNDAFPELNSQENIEPGNSFSFVFSDEGTYGYHDNLHPERSGTVIVVSE